jgi:uncharacterized protein (DUF849 family)
MMQEVHVKPEIEAFDPGMIYNAVYYLKKGVLAESNMQFVARAKRCIEEFTCEVATPDEAREILNLK